MSLLERFGRKVAKGEVLFREGEPGDAMYVIQSGKVRLSRKIRGEDQVVAELGPGEFFGEMSILNGKPRSATAEVIEDAQLLVLDPKTFESMIKANTEIAVRMIKKLARRLDEANERIETLMLRDINSRVVHTVLAAARADGEATQAGVRVGMTVEQIAQKSGIEAGRVAEVLGRMQRSGLLQGDADTLVVPDLGRLQEFLEFLEMRERFDAV